MEPGRVLAAVALLLQLAVVHVPVDSVEAHSIDTEANTLSGRVRGNVVHGSKVWLGLPFAQAPVGSLRWRPPQPPSPWKGTRNASAYGPACPQMGSAMVGGRFGCTQCAAWTSLNVTVASEDCLYLNVFAPARVPFRLFLHHACVVRPYL